MSYCSELQHLLKERYGLHPVWGAELEFYLRPTPDDGALDVVWHRLRQEMRDLPEWEHERGEGQFEVAWPVERDAQALATRVEAVRNMLITRAPEYQLEADFRAKPLPTDYGSALHIHLHLEDAEGNNVFTKKEDVLSPALSDALGGLLATLPDNMPVFFPSAESQARIAPKMHAPTTVSWGANNRTTALRLPDVRGPYRRIEHRVACAESDVAAVIAAILEGVLYGLQHHSDPGAQVHGDASDKQYGLPTLKGMGS